MVRTTVVGSWPVDARYAAAMEQYHAGAYPGDQTEQLLRQVAQTAIEQQRACGLQEITGGETSADTFILQFPKYLAGIESTGEMKAWDGRGTYRITGPLGAPDGLGIAAALRRERTLDPDIVKVTIPGPSEITMMIETGSDAARLALWDQAIELIRAEIRECIELGATDIQLDLPHIAMGLADSYPLWSSARAVEIIGRIFEGFAGIRRSIHVCYGDFQARTWTQNRTFHPLPNTIQALDGVVDRVVLEFSLPEQWADRAQLAEIPANMEVAAGIVDVKSPVIESPAEIEDKIGQLLDYIPKERLLICPSCGFGRRNTELAVGKSRAMTQAVARVNGKMPPMSV